jgi:hypothetical protein
MPRSSLTLLVVAAAALTAGVGRAADVPALRVDIHGESGASIQLNLPLDRLADWVPGARASLSCEGAHDRDTRRLMEVLERSGENSSYRFEDDDGVVIARRSGGQLLLEKTDDGDRGRVEMPWLLAECFLGGRPVQAEVRDLLGHGHRLLVDIRGDDGGRVRISVD